MNNNNNNYKRKHQDINELSDEININNTSIKQAKQRIDIWNETIYTNIIGNIVQFLELKDMMNVIQLNKHWKNNLYANPYMWCNYSLVVGYDNYMSCWKNIQLYQSTTNPILNLISKLEIAIINDTIQEVMNVILSQPFTNIKQLRIIMYILNINTDITIDLHVEYISKIAKHLKHVKNTSVEMNGSDRPTGRNSNIIEKLFKPLKNIEKLVITYPFKHWYCISPYIQQVKELSVSFFPEMKFYELLLYMPELEILNIIGVMADDLKMVKLDHRLQLAPKLHTLSTVIYNISQSLPNNIQNLHLLSYIITSRLDKYPILTNIKSLKCSTDDMYEFIFCSEKLVNIIIDKFPNLTTIHILYNNGMCRLEYETKTYEAIVDNLYLFCTKVKHLKTILLDIETMQIIQHILRTIDYEPFIDKLNTIIKYIPYIS